MRVLDAIEPACTRFRERSKLSIPRPYALPAICVSVYAETGPREAHFMETAMLDEAIDSFISFIRSLPGQTLEASRTERWGPREVLIHLVFWHEQYASIATAVAAKRPPKLHPGTIRDVNISPSCRTRKCPWRR